MNIRKALDILRDISDGTGTINQLRDLLGIGHGLGDPVILYGPYDAIWPTIGVQGHGWGCVCCGRNRGEFSTKENARDAGEVHGSVHHPGLAITYTEVHLDTDEAR